MSAFTERGSSTPQISVVVLTRNRLDVLRKCVASVLRQQFCDFELIVLDDASDELDTASSVAGEFSDRRVHPFRSTQPLGVAGGRNYLMDQCRGDYVVAIDDDAVFVRDDSLHRVLAVLKVDPAIGAVAFRVTNVLGEHRAAAVPFSRAALLRRPDAVHQPVLVSYFIGCGHALRRRVVQRLGGYRSDMVYGAEELDLAYRMISAGYSITYEPQIEVEHFPQPSVVDGVRRRRASEQFYQVRNRAYLAYRYLPWRYAIPYVAVWLARYTLRALRERRIGEVLRGVAAVPQYLSGVPRDVLSREGLAYLSRHGGRLWY